MININLLPSEVGLETVKQRRIRKLHFFGVASILLLIFLSSVLLSLSFLQSRGIRQTLGKIQVVEQRVISQQSKEATLVVVKNRIGNLSPIINKPSKQREMYELINSLLPQNIAITSSTLDRTGNVIISATSPDSRSLDLFFEDLLSAEKGKGKIAQVEIESLNRGRDGVLRVNFKAVSKI